MEHGGTSERQFERPELPNFELLVIGRLHVPLSEVPLLEQFARVRAYLRREVDRRLRELATSEPLELACPDCGAPVEVSPSYHEKVRRGATPQPKCYGCKRPTQAAQADAEAVRFVEVLDSAEELAAAVAALS